LRCAQSTVRRVFRLNQYVPIRFKPKHRYYLPFIMAVERPNQVNLLSALQHDGGKAGAHSAFDPEGDSIFSDGQIGSTVLSSFFAISDS
jgi:hypothetical protein